LIFHCNNCYAKAPLCYVSEHFPTFLWRLFSWHISTSSHVWRWNS